MIFKNREYFVEVDDCNFFYDDEIDFRSITIKQKKKTIFDGVVLKEVGDIELMTTILNNIDKFTSLPKVNDLPEPLKTIVLDQADSNYGMYVYQKDENFPFSEKQMEELAKQISDYHLETYIELYDMNDICDARIECYMGLCTNFNFYI